MGSNSTHTSLVSWRLDDDSRSAWDILWACGSTIFACTWTVIHADVPNRDATNFRQTIMFLRTWFMALLVPEVIFGFAWLQLTNARESQNMYNVALNHEPTKLKSPETSMHSPPEKLRADPGSETWSLVQAFCINAGALALRTKDEWVYSVLTDEEMVDFITSGTVRPSDLPEQEIQSRAKADSFAKLFTLFQVTWFLCNAFTRWGYHIPVSPLELATVAYVVIAILTYLTWWYKPKDISTPVLVILPCDRRTLEANFPDKIDSHRWTHLKVQVKKETMLDTLKSSLTTSIFVIDPPQEGEVVRKKENKGATILSFISLFIYSFAALAYSGIHLAAWDFDFPTHAERIAWNSLNLIAIGVVVIFIIVDFAMAVVDYLRENRQLPSFMVTFYDESHWKKARNIQLIPKRISTYIYVITRLGIMALVCASMRALPEGSYTTVEWVSSIPHF